ncbi:MAG TPA: helix-turn-helix transcriptional regulator [Polyangiaceae bacterium]
MQRRVVEHLGASARCGRAPDPLFVEEAMVRLLSRAARASTSGLPARGARVRDDHRALADACRARLAERLDEPLPLTALARSLGVSPYHLARVFRRECGATLHATRNSLRLRTALERVSAGDDLARVAVDLGFASHSHFTALFRRAFGVTPSRFRAGS